jgi:uncharacterized protein YrrD
MTGMAHRSDNSEPHIRHNNEGTTMLHKVKTLQGYTLNSLDGEIGQVSEFYFDDRHWAIRYLVVDTGNWLTGRQVLISPYALVAAVCEEHRIAVDLTRKQIEDSPSLNCDKPVSRQYEDDYYRYYGWPMYWDGPYMWGNYPYLARDSESGSECTTGEKQWDPHLRSTHSVHGYHLQASDGEIGHIDDFIIDDDTWAIRYLIVDTRNWWPGKKVLISPQWIERVSWEESKVFVKLSLETIKGAPEYLEETAITRGYEKRLYEHYKTKIYWVGEPAAMEYAR